MKKYTSAAMAILLSASGSLLMAADPVAASVANPVAANMQIQEQNILGQGMFGNQNDAAKAARKAAKQTKADAEKSLASKVSVYEAEKVAAEKVKKSAVDKLAAEEKSLVDLEKQLKAAKKVKNNKANVKAIKVQIKDAKKSIERAEDAVDVAEDRLDKAQKNLRKAQKAAQKIKDEAARAQRKEKRLSEAELNEKRRRQIVAEYDAAKKNVRAQERLHNELEDLKNEYDNANSKLAAAEKKLLAAKKTLAAADESVKAASKDQKKLAAATKSQKEAKKAVDSLNKDIVSLKKQLSEKKFANITTRYNNTYNAKIEADRAFSEASRRYNNIFKSSHSYNTENLNKEEVKTRLARIDTYKFKGDTAWLAGTSVDGIPLLDAFKNNNPVEACKAALALAFRGGFLFAGFADADAKTFGEVTASSKHILVDSGRLGPIDVVSKNADGVVLANKAMAAFSDSQIERRFAKPSKLNRGTTFNYIDIQKRFIELNGHPDIEKVDIAFTPGFAYMRSDYMLSDYMYDDGSPAVVGNGKRIAAMDVEITEKGGLSPMHLILGINNYNSLGEMDSFAGGADTFSANATLQFLNLWKADHAFTFNGSTSLDGSLFGTSASYYIPRTFYGVGPWWDWSWTVHGGYTDVNQDEVVPSIDVEGTGYFAGINASKRIIETKSSNIDFSFGLTWRSVESALVYDNHRLEMGLDGEGYDILPFNVALSYSSADIDSLGGRNYATIEGVYNVGGSKLEELQAYRQAIEDENYWLVRAQAARIQTIGDHRINPEDCWFLFVKFDFQYANQPVVGPEQFGLGGYNSIRGYAGRQFMGDTGFCGTIELRTPIYVGIFDSVRERWNQIDRWQFVTFFDFGSYELEKGINNTEDDSETLCSAGVGLRLALSDYLQARLDWGVPLVKDDDKFETSDAGRVNLSVSCQF